jgi:hypothetical protein
LILPAIVSLGFAIMFKKKSPVATLRRNCQLAITGTSYVHTRI